MRSFRFEWFCVCGAAWRGNLVRSPANPDIRSVLSSLRKEWVKAHSGEGHRETTSGHEAAWARRKAEAEAFAKGVEW
jgi:hypothetical protein